MFASGIGGGPGATPGIMRNGMTPRPGGPNALPGLPGSEPASSVDAQRERRRNDRANRATPSEMMQDAHMDGIEAGLRGDKLGQVEAMFRTFDAAAEELALRRIAQQAAALLAQGSNVEVPNVDGAGELGIARAKAAAPRPATAESSSFELDELAEKLRRQLLRGDDT